MIPSDKALNQAQADQKVGDGTRTHSGHKLEGQAHIAPGSLAWYCGCCVVSGDHADRTNEEPTAGGWRTAWTCDGWVLVSPPFGLGGSIPTFIRAHPSMHLAPTSRVHAVEPFGELPIVSIVA